MSLDDLEDRYQGVPFAAASAYLAQKISLPTDGWRDTTTAEHDAAFVVAGAKGSLLTDLKKAVERAIQEGQRPADFQTEFERIAKNWSHTGGADWRAQLILRQNQRSAYAAGRYERQLSPAAQRVQPYLQFLHSDSANPRPAHIALHRMVFRSDAVPFWLPNGFGCDCRYRSLSERQLQRLGLEVSDLQRGDTVTVEIDGRQVSAVLEPAEGFDYRPGASSAEERTRLLQQQVNRMPPRIGQFVTAEARAALSQRGVDVGSLPQPPVGEAVERPDITPQPLDPERVLGVTQAEVDAALDSPLSIFRQADGQYLYLTPNLVVVVASDGTIQAAYPPNTPQFLDLLEAAQATAPSPSPEPSTDG